MNQKHKAYCSRSHTKKQRNNCKPKLPLEEKQKRKKAKRLSILFPNWHIHLHIPFFKKSSPKGGGFRRWL
jgi:hypothetical protein